MPRSTEEKPQWFVEHTAWEHTKNIPARVRQAVLDRDGAQCQLCGTTGENRLTLHHWYSYRSHGGPHVEENLITLCFRCHADVHEGRQDITLIEVEPGVWAAFPGAPKRRKPL